MSSNRHFGSKSTAEEVVKDIELNGKNIIITGANTGIGKVEIQNNLEFHSEINLGNSKSACFEKCKCIYCM
jgi:hypothetical protein